MLNWKIFRMRNILFSLLLLVLSVSEAGAILPQMELPEWNRTRVRVVSWNPSTREIGVETTIEALGVPVLDLAATIDWPDGFERKTPEASVTRLEPGKKWVATHIALAPKAYEGFLEIVISARPDQESLRRQVESIATLSALAKTVMLKESGTFVQPVPLGRSIQLYIDENIAIPMPHQALSRPLVPLNSRSLFVWAPETNLGGGLVAETYDAFKKALKAGDADGAIKDLAVLDDLLGKAGNTVSLGREPNQGIQLRTPLVRETLLQAKFCLMSKKNLPEAILGMRDLEKDSRPSLGVGFFQANLATLLWAGGYKKESAEYYRKALELIPAWPLVEKWSNEK